MIETSNNYEGRPTIGQVIAVVAGVIVSGFVLFLLMGAILDYSRTPAEQAAFDQRMIDIEVKEEHEKQLAIEYKAWQQYESMRRQGYAK